MAKTRRKTKRTPKKQIDLPTESRLVAQEVKDHIMLVFGPPGIGKTTFVNQLSSSVLFISTDRGTRSLSAKAQEVGDWKEVEAVLDALEAGQADNYDMVALDHIDDLAIMAEERTCAELGIDSLGDAGFAKGWNTYKRKLHSLFARLRRLDLGIVGICHETIKTVRTRSLELERTMPDLTKSAWKVIVPLADAVIYCGFHSTKVAGKRKEIRTIETEPREDLYCKDRTNRTKPSGIEKLDGAAFIETFSTKPQRSTPRTKKKVSRKKAVRRTRS